MRPTFVATALAAILTLPAAAQEAERYTLEKSENGYVRMDNETGQMSICEERGSQLVCKLAANERTALQTEIEGLQGRIDDLDRRLAALEKSSPAVTPPGLPTDEEFEKTLGFMERFFRRFMDIVKDLDKEPAEPEGAPQKT